ncbi:MAG: hypothetical protein Q7T82_01905 [Armatimonadota bacterium]|nr:hypothetical protein [Armatimonadota bacterium]
MRRVLVVLTVLALSAPAWGITGKVVDNRGRPVAKAKVGIWTFWTSGRAYHADRNGEFVAYRNIASDGTVYGTNHKVVDADGKPVPNAIAIIPWGNNGPIRSVTDKKGQFTFEVPGYWDRVYRVKNSAGAPVPRAKVIRDSMSEIVTDDKGEYRLEGSRRATADGKECSVNVLADGYTYASVTLPDAEKARWVVVKLRPERIFKARIVDENGAPLRGARVIVESATGEMKDGGGFSFAGFDLPAVWITSGKDGYFELRHLPDPAGVKSAQMELTIDAPGRARIERRTYRLAELRKSGKITLPRACVVQGTLRPPAGGKLLDDLLLQMRLVEDGPPVYESERRARIDKDGKYRFDNLPPGEATITMSTSHRRTLGWTLPAAQQLPIAPGEVKTLDLAGATGAVISGIVRDKATGNPLGSAALTYEDAANPKGNWWVTEDDGTYSIRVAPGKVTVYVSFIWVGDKQVEFDRKDGVSLEVADGQDKSGVDLSISLPVKGASGAQGG